MDHLKDNRSQDVSEKKASPRHELTKRSVVLGLVLIVAAFAVAAHFSRAWFRMNDRVNAQGMKILARASDYELAVKGGAGAWDDAFAMVEAGENVEIDGETYSVTGSRSEIYWNVDGESNMNNLPSIPYGLDPGCSGEMTFYILAGRTGSLTVNFTLQLEGWSLDSDNQPELTDTELQQLLEGHVLLFAGTKENPYQYWISEDALPWTIQIDTQGDAAADQTSDEGATLSCDADGSLVWTGNVEEGSLYPVTIYWIWPEVLGQYLFRTGEYIGDRPVLFPVNISDAQASQPGALPPDLYQTMCSINSTAGKSNRYFAWKDITNEEFETNVSAGKLESLRASYNTVTYGKLCSYYNTADQILGDQVRYLTLRLDNH